MTQASPRTLGIDARMLFSSGIGTVIQNVLRRLPSERWRVTIMVADENAAQWVRQNRPEARTVLVPSPIYSCAEQWAVPRAVGRVDLFWSPHYNIPLFYPGRLVATVHDVAHLARPDFFPGLAKQAYARLLLQGVRFRCRKVVCVSEFSAKELVRLTGFPPSRLRVIPNGVDQAWFEQLPPSREEVPYFVYVGNVKPNKNLLRLLRAFGRVMDRMPHRLRIVGRRDGFITGDPQVELQATRLGDRVQFTGWLGEGLLRQTVAQATALVFPSLYEGFGLPVLEAMACGCPVLSSSATSLPEVGGSAAVYFNPESVEEIGGALIKASTWTTEERNRLVQKGRERASLFSWDKSVDSLLAVFAEASA